ncbi:Uncharacterised protein [Serratia fonticola]|uniref:Uncharacterized protein n=1 Tax=Serratia fonticola TaxID=47917 RepID=A0A4U9VNE3_SERFO|nr:Uncharacterised protein [Serratia fonticola]
MFPKRRQQLADKLQSFDPVSEIQHKLQLGRPIQAVNLRFALQQANQITRIDPVLLAKLDKAPRSLPSIRLIPNICAC